MDLTSLSTFIPAYISRTDIQPEDLDEGILMEFATEAVQRLQSERTCNHVVTLIPIVNYNAPKPVGCYKFVEIAYHGDCLTRTNRPMYYDEVVSWTDTNFAGCDVKISVECPRCHEHQCECGDNNVLIRVDEDWRRANVERQYWNNPRYAGAYGLNKDGNRSSFYNPGFSLMRPALHKFFGANYHVRGCVNLDGLLMGESPVEYKIENRKIRTNAETGTVLLAYLAIPTDEAGFPLVPDDPDVFKAIYWDVESQMLYRNKRKAKENYAWSQDAEKKSGYYMRRAKTKIDAIPPLEWYNIIRNTFKKIPYRNSDEMAGRLQADRFKGALRRTRNGG